MKDREKDTETEERGTEDREAVVQKGKRTKRQVARKVRGQKGRGTERQSTKNRRIDKR